MQQSFLCIAHTLRSLSIDIYSKHGFIIVNDMQTPPPPFKNGQIGFLFEHVAQCSVTNEKTI